jgi:hypothetical protein
MSRMSNTKYPRNDGGLFLDATTRIFRSTHRICLHAYYAQLWASIKEVPEVPLLLSKLSFLAYTDSCMRGNLSSM